MAEREKKVLIIDDEETVGIGMSEMLKDAGFKAQYVTSGKDGINVLKDTDCSLVFMDMIMPGLNGLETFREIKKVRPGIRVVLFTGYFKDADRDIFQGVKEGMIDAYIRKPFFSEEIVSTATKYA
ncbi:MAG: response regulator [Deltaproteobacteria bacterium]|nr:response regulator [Deltaproteobacteria bacterium]